MLCFLNTEREKSGKKAAARRSTENSWKRRKKEREKKGARDPGLRRVDANCKCEMSRSSARARSETGRVLQCSNARLLDSARLRASGCCCAVLLLCCALLAASSRAVRPPLSRTPPPAHLTSTFLRLTTIAPHRPDLYQFVVTGARCWPGRARAHTRTPLSTLSASLTAPRHLSHLDWNRALQPSWKATVDHFRHTQRPPASSYSSPEHRTARRFSFLASPGTAPLCHHVGQKRA